MAEKGINMLNYEKKLEGIIRKDETEVDTILFGW
jgi:hypothetical protein